MNVLSKTHISHILKGLMVIACYLGTAFSVHAAEVVLSPSTGSYGQNQTFTVTIQAVPGSGESINAVESTLTYDTSRLSVVSVSKNGSVFSLWTTEPTFSNSAGTIEFGGGSPTPFSSRSTLLTVTFRASGQGDATVSFQNASALAADGQGTDVLSGTGNGTYSITEQTTTPSDDTTPTETEETDDGDDAAVTFGEPPRAPTVGSQTFIQSDEWYATSTGMFTWELPFDVTAVAYTISTSSETIPDHETAIDPPIEEITVTENDLREGRQYLHVQFQNQVGWGATAHRQVLIDTRAPEPFEINVRAGRTPDDFPLLRFNAEDQTSGVEMYELTIAGGEPVEVTPEEAELGYLLSKLEDGTVTVRVTAHDRAGNTRTAEKAVIINAGWTPPEESEEDSSFFAFLTFKNVLIILLIAAIALLVAVLVLERRRYQKKEEKLRKETREIQDQMEKIFSALRDEIYDQINTITKRPRLSKKEREAVESLNNALEVSETLIEKEITDVNKILK